MKINPRLGLLLFLGCASLAFGQGVFIPPQTAFRVVNGYTSPLAGATITVCAASTGGIPCSPALVNTIFKDQALTEPLSNPFPADATGNYQFAIAAGTYTVTVTAFGFDGNSYQITAGGSGGGAVASVANSDGTLNITPTTGAVIASLGLSHANTWTGLITAGAGLNIPSGQTLTIQNGGTLTCAAGATCPPVVTNIATTSPLSGGPITNGIGTFACAPCATTVSGGLLSAVGPVAISSAGVITQAASLLNAAYGGNGNGTSDNSAAVTADCAANPSQIYLPAGAYAFTSSYTVPCPMVFGAGATLVVPTGVTLTMDYCPVKAPPVTLFTLSGSGAIQFAAGACTLGSGPYPEWWGATGNSGSPTDQVRINACFASLHPAAVVGGLCQLQAKFYYINAPVTLATNATTLWGAGRNSTIITTNSATADIITITGVHDKVQHMALFRSIAGSAGATGVNMSVNFSAAFLDDLQIQDSPYAMLLQNGPGVIIQNSLAAYTATSSTGVAQYCINVNGPGDSTQIDTFNCENLIGASLHVWGLWEHGTNINDLWTYNLQCTQTDHCIYIDGSASNLNYGSDDIHHINVVADQDFLAAVYVTGISASNGGTVDFDGGYFLTYGTNGVPVIDIESSTGVTLRGIQIPNSAVSEFGVLIHGGSNNILANSQIRVNAGSSSGYAVKISGSTNNNIAGNSLTQPATGAGNGILLVSGANLNNIASNQVIGNSSTVAISADSTSDNNQFTSNVVSGYATLKSDAGSGNVWNGPAAPQTTVNCSTSGTAIFSESLAGIGGTARKTVTVYQSACLGTASYTFPTAFTNTPQVLSQSLAATATSVSTTAVTITGSTNTGYLNLDGF